MSDNNDIAIKVESVSKQFLLPHQKAGTLKSFFVNPFSKFENEKQMALDGVSFDIKKGEFFGIVGRNGSGKSTLLKCMAGVYTPDKGRIKVSGSLVPFIELGVGFNPELSGRDNVYLNGALLGFSRPEIDAMYQEIVDFAELEKFMDQKLKNYSSGMQVRLAFSIAIKAQGDILLLDEILAVGDTSFQQKCYEYFATLKKQKKTIVLVTHDMASVQRFCNKALLLNGGKITHIGQPASVTEKYVVLNRKKERTEPKGTKSNAGNLGIEPTNKLESFDINVQTLNKNNEHVKDYYPEDDIIISLVITAKKQIDNAFVGITLQKSNGDYVYWLTTEDPKYKIDGFNKGSKTKLHLKLQNIFGEDTYSVNVSIKSNDRTKEYLVIKDAESFNVLGTTGKYGWMLRPNVEFKVEKK